MREYMGVFDFKLEAIEVKAIADAGLQSAPEEQEYVPRVIQYHRHVEAKARAAETERAVS